MAGLEMFNGNIKIDNKTLISEIENCKFGELLPDESSGRFLHERIEYDGQFVFIKNTDNYILCFCDNEISINDIELDNIAIAVRSNEDMVVFTIINKNADSRGNLTIIFKNNNTANIEVLENIKKTGILEIYFFSIILGGFSKEKHKIFRLTQDNMNNIVI